MTGRYVERFLRYLEIEKNYSPHTLLNYRIDLQDFVSFCAGQETSAIAYLEIRKYLALLKEKKLASRSVARRLSCLRSFFNFLCREGLVKHNPVYRGFHSPAGPAFAGIPHRGRGGPSF